MKKGELKFFNSFSYSLDYVKFLKHFVTVRLSGF